MNMRTVRATAVAAGLILLSGCSKPVTGAAQAGTGGAGDEPAVVETVEPVDPTSADDDQADTADDDQADTGDGDQAYASDIAWLSAFCYDFDDINDKFDVHTEGAHSADEAVQQVTDGYDALIDSITSAKYELEGLPMPTFPGSDDFTALVHDWDVKALTVYQLGVHDLRAGTYESGADLKQAIDEIESQMDEPLDRLNAAIGDLDPVAKAIMGELPECAYLVQNPSSEAIGGESAAEAEPSSPAGDGSLDAASEQWMSTFCSGVSDVVTASQSFDVTGMSNEEVLSLLFHTYAYMSTTADSTRDQLGELPPPTFAGADTIAPALLDWLAAAWSAYGDGANIFAEYEFTTKADLQATIKGIESAMDGPNAEFDTAMASIDPSVKAAVQAMPECAFLTSL